MKTEQKKRSESSKLPHPHIGLQFNKQLTINQLEKIPNNIVDFTNTNIAQTKSGMRPKTAFKPTS